jgi:hypothetical protein
MRRKIGVAVVVLISALSASVGLLRGAGAAESFEYVTGTFFASTGWAVHIHNPTSVPQVIKFKTRNQEGVSSGNGTQTIAPKGTLPLSESCTDCGRVIQLTANTDKLAPVLTYTTSTAKIAVHPGSWLVTRL